MMFSNDEEKQKWLCQRCGNCCKWPGLVRVTDAEIDGYAKFLEMSPIEFIEQYTAVTPDRTGLTLISHPDNSCIFLKQGNICIVNDIKPVSCAGFPNEWNNPGWQEKCEAIAVPEKDYLRMVLERDQAFEA